MDTPGQRRRPQNLRWLDHLLSRDVLAPNPVTTLDVFGLLTDQANVLDWRRESLSVPVSLIRQSSDAETDRRVRAWYVAALQLAELVGRFFVVTSIDIGSSAQPNTVKSPLWVHVEKYISIFGDTVADWRKCSAYATRYHAAEEYWMRLGPAYRDFVVTVSATHDVAAFHTWIAAVERVATDVFAGLVTEVGFSGRALKAATLAQRQFDELLATVLTPYRDGADQDDIAESVGTVS